MLDVTFTTVLYEPDWSRAGAIVSDVLGSLEACDLTGEYLIVDNSPAPTMEAVRLAAEDERVRFLWNQGYNVYLAGALTTAALQAHGRHLVDLADDPTIKVIHLYRENKLAQLASWKIAELLGQWGDQSEVPERPTIEIARGELTWFDRFNTALYRSRLNRLTRHPLLKVSYESLRDDWPFTLHRVLAFLGVEQLALDQCAIRGETRPLSEVISNYHEFNREAA